jgi:hypothetical protein
VVNLLLIWIFFGFVLRNVMTFGWIWWVPVAFIETVVLLENPNTQRFVDGANSFRLFSGTRSAVSNQRTTLRTRPGIE